MAGKIIALDGADGCGKTTISALVVDRLREKFPKRPVGHFQQPGATALGQELRKLLKARSTFENQFDPLTERFLFAADNVNFIVNIIQKLESDSSIVVLDRFNFFTDVIYGTASGLSIETILDVQRAIPKIRADLLIVLRCPFDVSSARKIKRAPTLGTVNGDCRIESKGDQFMRQISSAYEAICPGDGYADDVPWGHMSHALVDQLNFIARARARKIVCVDSNKEFRLVADDVKEHVVAAL